MKRLVKWIWALGYMVACGSGSGEEGEGEAEAEAESESESEAEGEGEAESEGESEGESESESEGEITGPGTRIPWAGGSWYLSGVNLPWYNWGGDFGGGSSWGASSSSVESALSDRFSTLAATGNRVVRWWVFPGDPWQFSESGGAPTELDETVYEDFAAAIALADTYDLYYVFVLFSSPVAVPSGWLMSEGGRTALATALTPLFAAYDHPRVLSWEAFNEPEFAIWNGDIAAEPVQATVEALADAVHANSSAYFTVGAAMLDGLLYWVGRGLDYYQAHWYDYMDGGDWDAFDRTYDDVQADYDLDAPLVIGELYLGADVSPLSRLETFYANGYAGAWPWSLFPERTSDGMNIDLDAMTSFAAKHSDIGP